MSTGRFKVFRACSLGDKYGIMIFETHAHFDDDAFSEDLEEVLAQARRAGVTQVVNIASDVRSIDRCLALTERYAQETDNHPAFLCALGIHPTECGELTEEILRDIEEKAKAQRVVAVGEIGLDYYWDTPEREKQRKWFIRQLEMAMELDKPVVIHSREAAEETFRILEEHYHGTGVIHCYSYSAEMAKEYVKRGWFIGVGGVVTYKNARKLKETVEQVPLSQIVLETDCPYLSPTPHRGKRNSSANLPLVAEEIARIRGITAEEVCGITYDNACRLYRI